MKKVLIVGATSAIATACLRLWLLKEPLDLILVGRNEEKLQKLSKDLSVRSPKTKIETRIINFTDNEEIEAMVQSVTSIESLDLALIAQGTLPDQALCQDDLDMCRDVIEINGISPILFAEAIAQSMERVGQGTLVVISSVAGDRGRKSNYTYGAAKGMLTRYVEGMQHRFYQTGVHVILVKPGPTHTPMTAHLKDQGVRLASVDTVARDIVRGVEAKAELIYTPSYWRWIMMVIEHLPNSLFYKIKN